MNYSIENLALKIQDKIEFTECEEEKVNISDNIDFDDFCISFDGYAKGYINRNAESILNEICIESASKCSLVTGNVIENLDSMAYLAKLEKLISW